MTGNTTSDLTETEQLARRIINLLAHGRSVASVARKLDVDPQTVTDVGVAVAGPTLDLYLLEVASCGHDGREVEPRNPDNWTGITYPEGECRNGHNTAETGRTETGHCAVCRKDWRRTGGAAV